MELYRMSVQDVLEKLSADPAGLSATEAKSRLLSQGENSLPKPKQKSLYALFIGQFKSPIIYLLLLATIIVIIMGEYVDAGVIVLVLLVNAVIGVFQEGKAQNTLAALTQYIKTDAVAVRDHREVVIPDKHVVVGDLLILKEGDKVPADARIIAVNNLLVDESALTGESKPASKSIEKIDREKLMPADQTNMIFRGTFVVSGTASVIVVATGTSTFIGGISLKMQTLDTDMPLKKHIDELSRYIIYITIVAALVIFVIGVAYGYDIREMFALVVAVSVSIIPEGLPVVMTLILAVGVHRMSLRHALVRKLQAVEALGHAKVIAVDKTGTVTLNQMIVKELYVGGQMYEVSGVGYEPKGTISQNGTPVEVPEHEGMLLVGKIAAASASATVAYDEEKQEWQRPIGDPTEAALSVFGQKVGYSREMFSSEHKRLFEIPFTSDLKYHAVFHDVDGKILCMVSGAPDVLIKLAHFASEEEKEHMVTAEHSLMRKGLRVIACGYADHAPHTIETGVLPKIHIAGLVGIQDDVRAEVPQAVMDAQKAGVKVVMITGDHKETAIAIARQVGIYKEGDHVITGEDIEKLTETDLMARLSKTTVFARVAPEHKLKIIELFKKKGEVIAMTGDGVNDALSLSAADLGVAMGKSGTEVAKEAADIVLLDDNFGSIVAAIEEGRAIYHTIKKVILYLFSTSIGELFVVLIALVIGLEMPFTASQIIWLNFITDGFLVAALAFENREHGALKHRLSSKAVFMDRLMVFRMIFLGATMMIGTLWLYVFMQKYDHALASSVALTVLAVFQWFNAWNCRSERKSSFYKPFSNLYLVAAFIIVLVLQLLALYSPLSRFLNVVPIGYMEWFIVVGIASTIIIFEEIRKFATYLYRELNS